MDANLRYAGTDLPLMTGISGGTEVGLDETGDRPLLWLVTPRTGDNLTIDQAETVGRALLAWAADMRLVSP